VLSLNFVQPRPYKKAKDQKQSHLDKFFAGYPMFSYDPQANVSAQYSAMCRKYFGETRKIKGGGVIITKRGIVDPEDAPTARNAAYAAFDAAMSATFGDIYGTEVNDIGNWHSLCIVLDITPIPQTLYACRAVSISLLFVALI
jgi:hypothetical protein